MTSKSFAKSATVRDMGPRDPATDGHPAYTPPRLTRPAVGRIPTIEFQVEGRRIDAKPSCPTPTAQKFAATLAPEPPEEPPAVRSGSYGLRVEPKREPWVSPPPSSPKVAFARMIAPAFWSFSTTKASRSG